MVFSSARAAPNLPAKLAIGIPNEDQIGRSVLGAFPIPQTTITRRVHLEYWLGANPLLHDLIEESFPVRDGLIEIPDRAGSGITIREDFLGAHTVK